jgi:MFS transporter, SP family, general alpha glucoside:H+ symporter
MTAIFGISVQLLTFFQNVVGIIQNTITPRMLSASGTFNPSLYRIFPDHTLTADIAWNWGAKSGLFYAGSNLLTLIWVYFRLPETKGRSFGELDLLFENKVSARKFKATKVDQFAHADVYEAKAGEAGRESVTHVDDVKQD